MDDVYIIGTAGTSFGKHPDKSFKELTRDAYLAVTDDAGLGDPDVIDQAWFGNCGMGTFGQRNIRGQVCFTPLVEEGLFPERVPIINVEGGCATASMAFHGAWKDILSGQADVSLAIGVEKTFVADNPDKTLEIFEGGIDQLDPDEWRAYYRRAGETAGKPFDEHGGGGTVFMNTYAMQAAYHITQRGSTQEQIAYAASKNHQMGSLNPLAQYRFEISTEEILADREVSWPLTRSMCAPVGDGAAAAILCSKRVLESLPAETQERAIRVRASTLTGGKYRALDEPSLSAVAAKRAYASAAMGPESIDIAEVHDATSFNELYQCEMLGFCEAGRGGDYVASGATTRDGERPINLSGGLVSKGHPVGATGLSMIYELGLQLRGEAGERQRKGARTGLAENGGGVIGFDEAACSIVILESQMSEDARIPLQ